MANVLTMSRDKLLDEIKDRSDAEKLRKKLLIKDRALLADLRRAGYTGAEFYVAALRLTALGLGVDWRDVSANKVASVIPTEMLIRLKRQGIKIVGEGGIHRIL